jgi:hypothetical protein
MRSAKEELFSGDAGGVVLSFQGDAVGAFVGPGALPAQLARGAARADVERRRDLGDHNGVPIDGPVDALDVLLGCAPGIRLGDGHQAATTRRVFLTRR